MTDIDPQSAVETMWKLAPLYAEAKAHRTYLEEYSKTLKAKLMKASGESAVNAQEREAYADKAYETHLEAIRISMENEEKLRWRLVTAQTAVDVWRTQSASNRMIEKATS